MMMTPATEKNSHIVVDAVDVDADVEGMKMQANQMHQNKLMAASEMWGTQNSEEAEENVRLLDWGNYPWETTVEKEGEVS
jgi:hypothetical protein